jgi:hypothetical protein
MGFVGEKVDGPPGVIFPMVRTFLMSRTAFGHESCLDGKTESRY